MKKQVIVIAGGLQVSIPCYIKAVKTAKENPGIEYSRGLTCWWSCTGKQIYEQFMDGLHDRINQAIKNKNIYFQ